MESLTDEEVLKKVEYATNLSAKFAMAIYNVDRSDVLGGLRKSNPLYEEAGNFFKELAEYDKRMGPMITDSNKTKIYKAVDDLQFVMSWLAAKLDGKTFPKTDSTG